ncbi:MAG TPA: hypothetical protein VJQ56_03050 [Blastocatellia bacterium]|nr:hypothetical protein [Blastocatellia bacterium]
MTTSAKKWLTRLRVFCALVVLATGWLAAPVALATQTSEVCAMTCCIEDGHCCCSPALPLVKGQKTDGQEAGDKAGLYNLAIQERCPEGCATSTISTKTQARGSIRAAVTTSDLEARAPARSQNRIVGFDELRAAPSSPRAPPAPLLSELL